MTKVPDHTDFEEEDVKPPAQGIDEVNPGTTMAPQTDQGAPLEPIELMTLPTQVQSFIANAGEDFKPEIPDKLLEITKITSPDFYAFLEVFLSRDLGKLDKTFKAKIETNDRISPMEKIVAKILFHTATLSEEKVPELFLDFYDELKNDSSDEQLIALYHEVISNIWQRLGKHHTSLFVAMFFRMYELREIPRMEFLFEKISADKFIPENIKLCCEMFLRYSQADHENAYRLFIKFHEQSTNKPELQNQLIKMTRLMVRSLLSEITDNRKLNMDEDILYSKIQSSDNTSRPITRHEETHEIIDLLNANLKKSKLPDGERKEFDITILTSLLIILQSLEKDHRDIFSDDELSAIQHKKGIITSLLTGKYKDASLIIEEGATIATTTKVQVQMLKDAGDIALLPIFDRGISKKEKIRTILNAKRIYRKAKDILINNDDPYKIIVPIQDIRATAILIRETVGFEKPLEATKETIDLLCPFILESFNDYIYINSNESATNRDIFTKEELSYYLGPIGHILETMKELKIQLPDIDTDIYQKNLDEQLSYIPAAEKQFEFIKNMEREMMASVLPKLLISPSDFSEEDKAEILTQFPLFRSAFLSYANSHKTIFIRQESEINQSEGNLKSSGTDKSQALLSGFREPPEKLKKEDTVKPITIHQRPDSPKSIFMERPASKA